MAHRVQIDKQVATWLREFREDDDGVGPVMVVNDDRLLALASSMHDMVQAMPKGEQRTLAVARGLQPLYSAVVDGEVQHDYQHNSGAGCATCGLKQADHIALNLPTEPLASADREALESEGAASVSQQTESEGTTVTQTIDPGTPVSVADELPEGSAAAANSTAADTNSTAVAAPEGGLAGLAAQVEGGQPVAETQAPAKPKATRPKAEPKAKEPEPTFERDANAAAFTAGMDPTKHEPKWPGGFMTNVSRNRILRIRVGLFDMQQAPQKVERAAKAHGKPLGRWVAVCQHGNFLAGTNGNEVYARMFRPWEYCLPCYNLVKAAIKAQPALAEQVGDIKAPGQDASYIVTKQAADKAEAASKAEAKKADGKSTGKGKATAAASKPKRQASKPAAAPAAAPAEVAPAEGEAVVVPAATTEAPLPAAAGV